MSLCFKTLCHTSEGSESKDLRMDSANKPDLHMNAGMKAYYHLQKLSWVRWHDNLQLHELPPVTQGNPTRSRTLHWKHWIWHRYPSQVLSELQSTNNTFCVSFPQPSWAPDVHWPGESRDSKKQWIYCKRRRYILSALLFLTGKKTLLSKKGQRAKVRSNCRFESHFRNVFSFISFSFELP